MASKALLELAHAYARGTWLGQARVCGTDNLQIDRAAVMTHVRGLRDRFLAGPIFGRSNQLAEKLGERGSQGAPRFVDAHTLNKACRSSTRIRSKSATYRSISRVI